MKTVAHRELRNRSADVLRAVQQGESFEITNNGQVVALLSPPASQSLQGIRFRPPLEAGSFADIQRTVSAESVLAVLDDLRGDR